MTGSFIRRPAANAIPFGRVRLWRMAKGGYWLLPELDVHSVPELDVHSDVESDVHVRSDFGCRADQRGSSMASMRIYSFGMPLAPSPLRGFVQAKLIKREETRPWLH
jgi:hypothetical protein